MSEAVVHVVGAGLAGLSAATTLAARGARVRLHEATSQAGGRCRSYRDPVLDMEIDNGNHLLLSGNSAALAYLDRVGGRDKMEESAGAIFPFIDVKTGERWTLRPDDGPVPWWVFDAKRRVPGTRARDYLALVRLLRGRPEATIADVIRCEGTLYDRLIEPLLLAALNTDPREGAAALAAAIIRETLAKGGRWCRPMIATGGLSAAFVAPALGWLAARGGEAILGHRLRSLDLAGDRVAALDFGEAAVALGPGDLVILAAPAPVASALVPGLATPDAFRAIVNAHFRMAPPEHLPLMTGIVGGLAQWLFAYPDRLSVTISAGDALLSEARETLAARIWAEVATVAGLGAAPMPPARIVREIRATFAATPAQEKRRPGAETRWDNLLLAGDWTRTGLPATIEGAIRSGAAAADIALARLERRS